MFPQDYEIRIIFTLDGMPVWKLYRKGEPVCANEEETKMVTDAFMKLFMMGTGTF